MNLGIIVCPKCKKTKAVDLSCKTTKCFRCNKSIDLSKVRILYKSDSEQKIRQAIGLVNADLDRNPTKF